MDDPRPKIRHGRSCSWCHTLNWSDEGPYCKVCGHLAFAPRLFCCCHRCQLDRILAAQRLPNAQDP